MGVNIHGIEFVQKTAVFVWVDILRSRKAKISNVRMLSWVLASIKVLLKNTKQ